jgi:hypothetical protein
MANVMKVCMALAVGVTLAQAASAQEANNQGGNSYPADMAGVIMADVPESDLCQLDGNPVLTADGQALVTAEIEGRPVLCGALPVLGATNLAFIAPVAGVALLAAIAAGGDGGGTGSTNNTQ